EYGLAGQTFELNKRAAEIAREVATGHAADGRPRFVIGSIGPGTRLPSLGQIRYETLRDDYELQVDGLIAGGVDVLLVETVYDLLQAKAAINGARRAMRSAGLSNPIPIMVQVTVETTGRMLVGTEIGAALTALEAMRPDVIGMNCATGPAEMTEHLRYLAPHARTVLDVCVDYVGRDGSLDMDQIAGRFATQASLPLVFDSTEPLVLEAGLQHHGGKALLNSANLEEGEEEGKRMDRVFRLAREYGAA